MSKDRIIVLKDLHDDRYLPIWIGPFEADAITAELQDIQQQRPLTHDLLRNVIEEMGGQIVHVLVNDLRNDVFYARILIDYNGERLEVDSRPSDAIAVAIRAKAPIFISELVMERASIQPEANVEHEDSTEDQDVEEDVAEEVSPAPSTNQPTAPSDQKLDPFKNFVNSLEIDLDEDED
ncbi:MAG: bifunctional nuclease family protein [Phototrophicaceae bacterium]